MSPPMYLSKTERKLETKTKIICTIGPKTKSVEMLSQLMDAGMNICRLNFSHGTHEYHGETVTNIRAALNQGKRNAASVAIMLDTKGPEIRTGKLEGHADIKLKKGEKFYFHNDISVLGNTEQVATTYDALCRTVKAGDLILVDDGLIGFRVLSCELETGKVFCIIENDGCLGETKGVNLPGLVVELPSITEKDESDIRFGVKMGVDFIAASFIRKASDVHAIRSILGDSGIKIISKIENQEGLENFDEILAASDGIMVARGDLGVEIPVEQVGRAQKMMIRKCNLAGKPCITATQMLESMIVNPRPTRAEACDVYNAILDGSDCVMLSGETAKGSHPIAAVEIMARICREAELDVNYAEVYSNLRKNVVLPISVSESVASSAVKTSWDVHAAMIIVLTESGATAQFMSKYRPIAPVLAVTANAQVARQMLCHRGIFPVLVETMEGTENIVHQAMLTGVQRGMAVKGDAVVVTSGHLEMVSGSTNIMRVKKCVGFDV